MVHEIPPKNNKKSSGEITFYDTKGHVFILYKTLVGDLAGDCFLVKKLVNMNLWQRLGLCTATVLCFALLITHLNSKYTLHLKHH